MKIRQNHVDYGYKPQFDAALFSEPSVNYWMAYSWIWNGDIDEDGIRQRIDDMFRENIRAMYILPEPDEFRPTTMGTHMNPGYFSPRYFELYRYAAEYALSKGMQVWLYDEAGWPSGMANGEVVQKNPELIRKTIAVNVKNYLAGTPYVKPDDVLAAFTEDNTYIDGAYTPASDERISEYVIQNVRYTNMPGPDLMDPRTAKEFLRCTHERYKAHMGDLFGPNFKITFTDEPAISRTPWTDGLDIKFKERFGYDFRRYLPAILQNAPMGEKGQQAKIDYFELCSEIFAESYFQSLQNWAKDNGMLSAGHIGGEDDTLGCVTAGYMNALRQLRCFDIPGIDTIWRQIFPKERDYRNGKVEAHNLFFPRFCTSAARQASSRPTVSESYAIYGSGLTCDQMRYVMNFQAVRGINIFNAMNLTYCLEDHFMAGARPTFSPMMPGSDDKAVFHEYAARLSYINSVGTPEVTAAVYMPIHDFWLREDSEYIRDEFEKIGKTIEAHQGVFDVFDDDVILNADADAL